MQHRIKPPDTNRCNRAARLFGDWARRLLLGKLARLEGCRLSAPTPRTVRLEPVGDGRGAVTVTVHDERAYSHIVLAGTTGAAESYILNYWDCDDLEALIELVLSSPAVYAGMDGGWAWIAERIEAVLHRFNRNSTEGSLRNIMAHYDLGNDFFALFLDETMAYSAGIFERPESTLHDASVAKFERICRKLRLTADDHLMEIGTGWGGFAIHAAKRYGCRVTTTTISREQFAKATERVRAEGLESRVTVLDKDYRELTGTYSRLVSIEMIEAVGHDYLDTFFGVCGRLLRDDGMLLIQGITIGDAQYESHRRQGSFINKYIFPGSHLVSNRRVCSGVDATTDMFLVSVEDITLHYARTLKLWRERFVANGDAVRAMGMSESFIRMWLFYLIFCEAGFRRRWIGDMQWVFGKPRCTGDLPALEEVT